MKQGAPVLDGNAGNVGSIGRPASAGKYGMLLPLAILVSSCGGGSGDAPGQVSPILRVGQQRQYTGTTTRTVVYANPTATLRDNTLVSSFTQQETVQQAPADAPADLDVHIDYAYTVVQDPGIGVVPMSEAVDNYESLLISGNTQTVTTLGQTVVAVSSDETSNALGNGPYTETSTTTSTYPTPRDNFTYPLQTGATLTVPQSQNQTIKFTDVNSANSAPSNGSNVGYTITRSENDDGSYSYQTAYVNGAAFSRTQNADGSGTQTYTNGSASSTTALSVPSASNGVSTIPVVLTVDSASTTTTNYAAADWYPDSGAPNSPLVFSTRLVVGPTTSLPSECGGALLRPDIDEVDTNTTSLNPIGASYSSTVTRNFVSGDAVSICQLSMETASSYNLDTGALVSTTTTATTTLLNSINY